MNAELEYALMKNHAEELRRVAAEHRRAMEATRGRKHRRSVLARLLSH
ncbi:hypothetical protein ACIBEJ_44630 [Nonomuraea sp. NPDC050790]